MTRTFHRLALPAVALAALMAVAPPAAAGTDTGWSPTSSERLAKLPAHYLKKALDRDFQSSGLAAALSDTESMIGLKKQTLADLRAAVDQAQGDLRIELRHQFLAEKRAYLDLVAKHQDLRKRRLKTSKRRFIFPLKTLCVVEGSALAGILGSGDIRINSLHNQSIDEVGGGLQVSGRDLDSIVQAVEQADRPFLHGVQWHPEFLIYSARQRALFRSLVAAAASYRAKRTAAA